MIALQTLGSVDTQRKLPAPRQFVVVSTAWGILFLVADFGAPRAAARLSLLMLLTATVLGPFGKRLVNFLNNVSHGFAIAPGAPGGVQSGGSFVPGPTAPTEPGMGAQTI